MYSFTVTKHQRERRKRLDEVKAWRSPSAHTVNLPQLPKGSSVAAFTFSLNEGIKWRVCVVTVIGYRNCCGFYFRAFLIYFRAIYHMPMF